MYKEGESALGDEDYRTEWRRDIARLIHSPSFRRLQGKTQLFPTQESDFFRNRLTHSLEVAQIAKSIAIRLNNTELKSYDFKIQEDICEFAGLAHDLGHPPFGHQGENALDECMKDIGGFEGNAQTLRILTKLEKKIIPNDENCTNYHDRYGLNLTFRSLASILKYDSVIPLLSIDRPEKWRNKSMKGYYKTEIDIVNDIKKNVGCNEKDLAFKTIECQIMDIADDIAYSTYDLEDGFKASFLEPIDVIFANNGVLERTRDKVNNVINNSITVDEIKDHLFELFDLFSIQGEEVDDISKFDYAIMKSSIAYHTSKKIASDGYHRTAFTSRRVGEAIRSIKFIKNSNIPSLSEVKIDDDLRIKIEILKHFIYESQIDSPKLKISEYRGRQIVKEIYSFLIEEDGHKILPNDIQELFTCAETDNEKQRVVGDFIAGMTDRYCVEFYYRIKSENPKTIFKPF